jgi:cell fate (sporulation/competence/biofilm development) regulator YlbF (YheA/YmcA/DUF963 family)
MSVETIPDLEMGLTGAVHQAVRAFAATLAATPQFLAFEQANDMLRRDMAAQRAGAAYQERQQSLHVLLMLNAVGAKEQAELDRLRDTFFNVPSVVAMLQAQEALQALCRMTADVLSEAIDLDVAAACGPRCCG